MERKKGFTLVELLTVIMILGLIGLIAVPTVTKVLKNSKQKLYNTQVAMIKQSGKKWGIDNINRLSETKKIYVTINDLVVGGYIEQNSLIDPRNTKKEMNGCIVIEYNDAYNKYEYSYVDESCRTINTNYELTSSDPEYACYSFNATTGKIVSYDVDNPACSKDVMVPNKIDGVSVVSIGPVAFVQGARKMCNINSVYTEVDLEYNCTTGYRYEWNEQTEFIESVEFPESLRTIGQSAFSGNMISSVNFDGLINLEYIDDWAFEENQIETVSFNNLPNLDYIYDGVFYGNYISSVKLKDLPLLKDIGYEAFEENNITSVILQNLDSLQYIDDDAFSYNQISNLIINNLPALEDIYYEAFAYNNLTSLNLTGAPNLAYIDESAFYNNNISSLNLSGLNNLEYIGESAFEDNQLTSITIPTSLPGISAYAFADNQIKSVTIPATITGIGGYAFAGNPIESVTIQGTDIYRFNSVWTLIGFPAELMTSVELTVLPVTLSTVSPNNFSYANYSYYKLTVPTTGSYKLEVWGAEGGGSRLSGNESSGFGGAGGYATGTVSLTAGDILYVYVGGYGSSSLMGFASGGWNGGGSGHASYANEPGNGGGGATDIRLVSGKWSDAASLNSRIIVAGGGGGGGEDSGDVFGHGGGTDGVGTSTYNATQNSAGSGGSFGIGGSTNMGDGGGGGGGWYGGGTLSSSSVGSDTQGGGGGSGYVFTASSFKPAGYAPDVRFYMTGEQLIAGNATMPDLTGGTMTGKTGDGYARITYLGA
ncbi:MAG: leucine-rich repeat protein [Ignavibacteriales bacterium]